MKKIFFFILLFLIPAIVSASSLKDLKVLNGNLSREFESDNNVYSVVLNEHETSLKLEYELLDKTAQVQIIDNAYQKDEENVTKLEITNSDGSKEEYVFFLEKEEVQPVFNDISLNKPSKKEIPHLIWYVSTGCICVILLLFKSIVLGFKRRNRK